MICFLSPNVLLFCPSVCDQLAFALDSPFQMSALHASHLRAESLSDLLRAFLVNYRGFEIKEFVERLVGALTAHSSRRDYTYRREADCDQIGGASGSGSQRSWQVCQIRMKQVIFTVAIVSILLKSIINRIRLFRFISSPSNYHILAFSCSGIE